MQRVHSVDYLRGILALLLMLYHYLNWQELSIPDADSFLTRNAIYGVSLFFIISGFSLTITYIEIFKKITFNNLSVFFIKRFARIYPLFWLITVLYLILVFLSEKNMPNIFQVIVNLTISFGFFTDYRAFTAGGWSIGVEIFLYALFPFLVWFLHKTDRYGELIYVLLISISIYISAYLLYDISDAENYWYTYTHPKNHIYFFIFGVLVGVTYSKKNTLFVWKKAYIEISLILSLLLFIFYPIAGEVINLILEENRVFLSIFTFFIFIFVVMYNSHANHKTKISRLFNFFGNISYTLYLLYPIVHMIVNHFLEVNSILKVIIMMLVTIGSSWVVYTLYERKLQKKIVQWSKNYVS